MSDSKPSHAKRTALVQTTLPQTDAKKARYEAASLSQEAPRTRVVRMRRKGGKVVQDCDVYVGRRCTMGGWNLPESKWHNPFVARDRDRSVAAAQYREWIQKQPELMAALGELKGKVLGCWCAPQSCHADVLAELADRV